MNNNINIAIILSAGNSERFLSSPKNELSIPKQLYLLNKKPIINHSIDTFLDTQIDISLIIVVINTKYYKEMLKIKKQYYRANTNIVFVINDIDCRIESINTAIKYINRNYDITENNINIIIHDSARPFINTSHITGLLNQMTEQIIYSQYYLKLNNGLMNLENHQILNRNDYVEICTPLCINYSVIKNLMENYINKTDVNGRRIHYEFIPLLKELGLEYTLLEGHCSYLRKITTYEDLFY
jgi:2-C-methyl-D-erythritol 4-phosphate cytidylyltransferase